jgi:hypothetical protein
MPWIGYFDKMDKADIFVLLDDVQYKKNEWQNRNKIRTVKAWQWLTVPVAYSFGQKISDINIDNKDNWKTKHIKSINLNYSKAAYFEEYSRVFAGILSRDWVKLSELNIYIINKIKEALGIRTGVIKSSDLGIRTPSTLRLVDICKRLGAGTYISGPGGKNYLDESLFEKNGIKLVYQKYEHPEYRQVYKGFCPYMSVVDLLFCTGPGSLDKIREGRRV